VNDLSRETKIIKLTFSTILLFTTLGCSHAQKQNGAVVDKSQESIAALEQTSTEVMQALALAEQKKDYRLWVTTSRSVTVPGLNPSDFNLAIELCGKQYMPKTGDVIRSEQERTERKKAIAYMQQYNEKMWVICANNQTTAHK